MLLLSPTALFFLRLLAGGANSGSGDDISTADDDALLTADDVLAARDNELVEDTSGLEAPFCDAVPDEDGDTDGSCPPMLEPVLSIT